VAKMHHALVDGLAAVDVSTVILDPTPEGLDLPPPPQDAPPEPRRTLVADQLAELAGFVEKSRQRARESFTRALEFDPREAAGQAREAAGVLAELGRRREPAPDTRLNIEIGRDRRYAIGRGRLDDVKAVRRAAGATVNDVLLGAVALMLEEYLGGDESPDHAIALVPVSIRRPDEEGELGNRISTVFCELPLRGDPLDRVRAIHSAMEEAKDSSAVRAGALIVGATGLAPPIVSSLAVRAMSGPRLFNLVVSNVPGPQSEFFVSGVPLLEAYPAVPLNPRNQALSVGILSYDGGVYFGLQADADALPDLDDAAAALERGLGRLVDAAR
jgi:diacylglycerol O-acyltransferase / wax synthase